MLSAVNGRNQTALMCAVQTGRAEIVDAAVKLIGDAWLPSVEEVRRAFIRMFSEGVSEGWNVHMRNELGLQQVVVGADAHARRYNAVCCRWVHLCCV